MLATAFALTLVMSKPTANELIAKSWQRTQVVGHRGAAAYKPENTLPSFKEAIDHGAPAVECDVHLSKDGEIMIMHAKTLDRTTDLSGPIKEAGSATLREAGIPTLLDLIHVTKDKAVLIVEIKDGDGIEAKVVDLLRKEKVSQQSIVFGFDDNRMRLVKQADPGQIAIWLVSNPKDLDLVAEKMAASKVDGFGVDYKNMTAEISAFSKRRRIPLFVWTVPPGEEVENLLKWQVNFIISNHPKDVLAQLPKP